MFLQSQCQPHIAQTVKESVEGICSKVYHLSVEYSRKVREKNCELLVAQGITGQQIINKIKFLESIIYDKRLYF